MLYLFLKIYNVFVVKYLLLFWVCSISAIIATFFSPNLGVVVVHVSCAQAYKAHVGGVSPRCGIEQIREALVGRDEKPSHIKKAPFNVGGFLVSIPN